MSRPRRKHTPLQTLSLRSAPLAKRALAWSPDAALAVAADDSVHVFVPQFREDGDDRPDGDDDDDHDDDRDDDRDARGQFAAGSRHIPVAHPPLDARLNRRLYAAAGLSFPGPRQSQSTQDPRQPHGAGSGPLTAAAGTMNSVVALAWSPVGVGRHGQAVLGVLAAAGVLTVYGPDGDSDSDDAAWRVLWAVGERFTVPPQTAEQARACVVSFAWSAARADSDDGRGALLVYGTDAGAVVVLRVAAGPAVCEVARFAGSGPHPAGDLLDPHYVPGAGLGSFGLQCSPWLADAAAGVRTCLVGYLARNYVGFRRVTVAGDKDGDEVQVDAADVDGLCLFLGTDAFLEWEPGLWTMDDGRAACRGVVATPLVAKAFEVTLALAGDSSPRAHPHDLSVCRTTYSPPGESHTNPIQGLIIHPPSSVDPGHPTYTLVRQSTTATNHDWFETNSTDPSDPQPQWAVDIARRVQVRLLPVADEDHDDEEEEEDKMDVDPMENIDPALLPGHLQVTAVPDKYRHRVRFWGLAMAPGHLPGRRGVTAVLVTEHTALQAERGSWYRDRSRVLFAATHADRPADRLRWPPRYTAPPASTEARMWTWMYGGGPPVLAADTHSPDTTTRSFTVGQTCAICAAAIDPAASTSTSTRHVACRQGHVFDRCSATGLAIQRPGRSRVCGVCGSRTLRADAVAAVLPELCSADDAAALRQAVVGDVCGRCGGKFHD